MKKLIFLLALIILAAAACKEKKPADYTRLGFFTPYQTYMEKLNGKVESVTEKNYWAIPEGDTLVRGARITKKELDSIGYTYDYKAMFDIDGDLVSCTTTDENDKVIDTWNFSKQNNLLARAEYTADDTVRFYTLITCDEAGNPYLYEMYDIVADTLVRKDEVRGFETNDTTLWHYYNSRGEPGFNYIAVFNESGLMTNSEYYRSNDTLSSRYTYVYNDQGFQSDFTGYDKDNNIISKTHSDYEYDSRGNWIMARIRDDKGFAVICDRVYTYFE